MCADIIKRKRGRPRKLPPGFIPGNEPSESSLPTESVQEVQEVQTIDGKQYLNGDLTLPKGTAQFAWSDEQILELARCKEDIIHFAENYFFINTIDFGNMKIKLYDFQKRVLRDWADPTHRFNLLCTSRQLGKTTITTIIALWLAFFSDNPQKIYILANKEDTAKGILERVKLAYRNMPNWIKAGVEEYTKTNIVFSNESTIKIAPTSTDAIRGVSASCILLDEMAFIRPEIQKAFFESVMPTMSSSKTAKIIAVSTPNGVVNSDGSINSFYQYYSKAELKEGHKEWNGWHSNKAMWYEVPGRDEEWKIAQLRTLNNDFNKWRQEFCCEFLESGASVLGTDVLERMKLRVRDPLAVYEDGSYRIFEYPQKNHIYVIGVDTAEGVGQDASVAIVLDLTDLADIRMVAEYWTNTTHPYAFAERLNRVRKNWNSPYLAIERNSTGGQIIDAIYNIHGYTNIIHYTPTSDKKNYYNNLGIYSQIDSKYTGIQNMRYWMDVLQALSIPDLAMLQEFETFIQKQNHTWGAQRGFHDDRVMALVWALVVLEKNICERYYTVLEYDKVGKPAKILDPNHIYGQDTIVMESDFRYSNSPPPTFFASVGMAPEAFNELVDLQEKGWVPY